MHQFKVNPRRRIHIPLQTASDPLDLGPVPFPELLHLMAALNRSFRRKSQPAALSNTVGDLLPVRRTEITSPERVPLLTVAVDERHRLGVGPARRRKAARRRFGRRWWRGGGGVHDGGDDVRKVVVVRDIMRGLGLGGKKIKGRVGVRLT
ncbi:hypothetical protein HanRHA438_Chr01g0028671 [Helianthus annuus]|nr:hypothetical protein HanRHA438_Chr01g0028671 [Helianthus annuus]